MTAAAVLSTMLICALGFHPGDLTISALGFHLGDSSIAAIIAASASVINGVILVHATRTQHEIREEVQSVKSDTERREDQIEELRSLSRERMKHIHALERVADRLEIESHGQWDGVERRGIKAPRPSRGQSKARGDRE